MTLQPEPDHRYPGGSGSDGAFEPDETPPQPVGPGRRPRRRGRQFAFGVLLTAGLAGLAVSAVGIAHQLLPRRFTLAQQRAISAWEVQRRWRALPAATMFPASVSYELPATALNAASGLVLHARRLGISEESKCTAAITGAATGILSEHGCSAAMRATYVDSSGSFVATVTVAVLPTASLARTVTRDLDSAGAAAGSPFLVRALRIADSPAAGFGDPERQLSRAGDAGPYVVLSTAGFSDDRHRMRIGRDPYLDKEMASLAEGLVRTADSVLGRPPPVPSCPGAPGC